MNRRDFLKAAATSGLLLPTETLSGNTKTKPYFFEDVEIDEEFRWGNYRMRRANFSECYSHSSILQRSGGVEKLVDERWVYYAWMGPKVEVNR